MDQLTAVINALANLPQYIEFAGLTLFVLFIMLCLVLKNLRYVQKDLDAIKARLEGKP